MACTSAPLAPPAQCVQDVDFYGDAFHSLSPDSLNAEMRFELGKKIGAAGWKKILKVATLEGRLRTARGAMTDSGQVVVGTFVGTFFAPLGQNSFDSTGTLYLSGLLKQNGDRYYIIFNVEFGTEGFVKTRGYIEFDWDQVLEDRIRYTGTFCFE